MNATILMPFIMFDVGVMVDDSCHHLREPQGNWNPRTRESFGLQPSHHNQGSELASDFSALNSAFIPISGISNESIPYKVNRLTCGNPALPKLRYDM